MSDAITGLIGAVLMIAFLSAIAGKLATLPLWIVCLVGIACMLYAYWTDALAPLFSRRGNSD